MGRMTHVILCIDVTQCGHLKFLAKLQQQSNRNQNFFLIEITSEVGTKRVKIHVTQPWKNSTTANHHLPLSGQVFHSHAEFVGLFAVLVVHHHPIVACLRNETQKFTRLCDKRRALYFSACWLSSIQLHEKHMKKRIIKYQSSVVFTILGPSCHLYLFLHVYYRNQS